jgi:hypothetical protein
LEREVGVVEGEGREVHQRNFKQAAGSVCLTWSSPGDYNFFQSFPHHIKTKSSEVEMKYSTSFGLCYVSSTAVCAWDIKMTDIA